MTSETTAKTTSTAAAATNSSGNDVFVDDKELPFTTIERIKLALACLIVYPLVLSSMVLLGPWILRTYPRWPPYTTTDSEEEGLWYGFWVTLITIQGILVCSLPFLFNHPRLVRERMSKLYATSEESTAEQFFHKITAIVYLGGVIGLTYDASSYETSTTFPKQLNWFGSSLMVLAFVVVGWVFDENKYASRVVHVQPGQRLITTGPYTFVRHPMYMAMVPMFYGFTLSLGSLWGLIPMTLVLISTAVRTYDEERFLVSTFGIKYEQYRKDVPYKMVPGIF